VKARSAKHRQQSLDGWIAAWRQGAIKAFAWDARTFCHGCHALSFCNVAQGCQ
jgi:hypothetical protein